MSRTLAIARIEALILLRNRWLYLAIAIMLLFALALTFAGSAPVGALGVDRLTVAVASMTTLSVYLIPLLALMMSFDAIAGAREHGGLGLVLSYPVGRGEILAGKAVAQLAALAIAALVGFGTAGAIAVLGGEVSTNSILSLLRLIGSAVMLGAVFLGLGYLISALAPGTAAASGMAAALWLVLVVLYDLGLLAAVVMDADGPFTRHVFPVLLTANPADAFRLWNIAGSDTVAIAAGMSGAASHIPPSAAPLSLGIWLIVVFAAARMAFQRVEP